MNCQVREQRKGERNGERSVVRVSRFTNAELIREFQLSIAKEGETRPEACFEGFLDTGWVNRDSCYATVRDFCGSVELNQFRQLKLSLWSPGAPVKSDDQRLGFCHFRNRHRVLLVIYQTQRWELLTDTILERHVQPPFVSARKNVFLTQY